MAETLDLNSLLSYSLNINFAPLQLHLQKSAERAATLGSQVQVLLTQNDELKSLLAGKSDGGVPLSEVLEIRAALAALQARIDALPPPQLFTWDKERDAMEAAERAALEARSVAMDAAGEATSAGEDARKAAAVAAAAAMDVRAAKPPPLNLSKIEERLAALEAAGSEGLAGVQALAGQNAEDVKLARAEAAAAAAEARAAAADAKEAKAAAAAAAAALGTAVARVDSLEFAVSQLKAQVTTLNSQVEMILATPPPPPAAPIDPNASVEAQALAGLQAELAALRAQVGGALRGSAEASGALAALEAQVKELAARPPPPPPPAAAPPAVDPAHLADLTLRLGAAEAACGKLGEGASALAARVGGCETGLAGHSKDLRTLKGALDMALTDISGLAARPVGGGGGGASPNEPDMLAFGGAVVHLLSIVCGGKADGGAPPAGEWRALKERAGELLGGARPCASAFDVKTLGGVVGGLERGAREAAALAAAQGERLEAAQGALSALAPRVPPPGALALLAAEDARLGECKADRGEVEAGLEAARGALSGLSNRVAEVNKALAALALKVEAGGGDSVQAAAATGRQLLRDLYCLSCSRPTAPQPTDRGPYSPTGILEPHTAVNPRALGHTAAGGGGGGGSGSSGRFGEEEEKKSEHGGGAYAYYGGGEGGGPPPPPPPTRGPPSTPTWAT